MSQQNKPMTLTPEQARGMFEWLKREGECWHEWERDGDTFDLICRKCREYHSDIDFFPNLSSPGWPEFGWAWERAKEKEWWEDFWFRLGMRTSVGNGKETYHFIPSNLIDPPRFFSALEEFRIHTK